MQTEISTLHRLAERFAGLPELLPQDETYLDPPPDGYRRPLDAAVDVQRDPTAEINDRTAPDGNLPEELRIARYNLLVDETEFYTEIDSTIHVLQRGADVISVLPRIAAARSRSPQAPERNTSSLPVAPAAPAAPRTGPGRRR